MVGKYFIKTLGCQMNYSDSERFASVLQSMEYEPTSKLNEADVIVINSCSVRQRAEDRVAGMEEKINELKKSNPRLKVILTGCMTKREARLETDPEKREKKERKAYQNLKRKVDWIDFILNVEDLQNLPSLLSEDKMPRHCGEYLSDSPIDRDSVGHSSAKLTTSRQNDKYDAAISLLNDYFSVEPSYQSEFQAYIPISTGCNNFCSYCIVPFTRGVERSRPFKEVVQEIRNLINQGYKEITLLGQNVNSYGNDLDEKNLFPKLLDKLDKIPGEFWIRFLSSHPKDISDELIDVIANGKHIAPQLHFAMQSGNNEVLKRMNRPYTIENYLEKVKKIRKSAPDIAITTDVIVGFPGETEEEFEDTLKAIKTAKFSMAYLNQYSPRKGTKSYEMKDDVPNKAKNERKERLNKVLAKSSLEFNKQFLGKKVFVLLTHANQKGFFGHTIHGVDVKVDLPISHCEEGAKPPTRQSRDRHAFASEADATLAMTKPIGSFAKVEITDIDSWSMSGKLVSSF